MMRYLFSVFKPIQQPRSEFLTKPVNSNTRMRQTIRHLSGKLDEQQIQNLVKGLPYLTDTESAVALLKHQIKYKQTFAIKEITDLLLKQPLTDKQSAKIMHFCHKMNLPDELFKKCINLDFTNIEPYYVSQIMWAMNYRPVPELQHKIIDFLPNLCEQFDFYSLSLLMQSTKSLNVPCWDKMVQRFCLIAKTSDIYALVYGLHAIAYKQNLLKNTQLEEVIKTALSLMKQNELLLCLWAMDKLSMGNVEFWQKAYLQCKAFNLAKFDEIALLSLILSKLFEIDEKEWIYLEELILNNLKQDEKSIVTIYKTFMIHQKGSKELIEKLEQTILSGMDKYSNKSLFKLAQHAPVQLLQQLPIKREELNESQKCLLFNLYTKQGLEFDINNIKILQLSVRDLVFLLYTIHIYARKYMNHEEEILNLIKSKKDELNEIDISSLKKLKSSQDIYS